MMIVKIQKSLSGANDPTLVYDQKRSLYVTVEQSALPSPITKSLRHDAKIYWHLTVNETGAMIWGRPAPAQDW